VDISVARSRKAVACTLSAIISAAMVMATSEVAFAAVPDPDPTTIACAVSTGFLSQGATGSDPTQLYAEQFGSGSIAFNVVGTTHGVVYNAISVNPANGYLYAVETSPNTGNLLRINPTDGTIEDLGATSPALSNYVAGSFDATGAHYYVSSGNSTSLYDVNVNTAVVTPIALVGGSTGLADYTVIDGYLWGFKSSAPVRIDASTGQVTTFAAVPGMPTGTYGAAFTLGNGDGEFGNNNGGVTQVHIGDPSSATPTFTIVATSSSNSASTNDGAACVSPATHLSVTADAPTTVAPNSTATWTVTVKNEGPAASSGFTLTDVLPTGYTAGTMSPGCAATGSNVSCTHGGLAVDESATITISATAPSTGSCGTGSVPNTIKVQGNEADSNPGAGDSVSSPNICVTGDTPQTIDFPQPVDTTVADSPTTLTATTTSGLAIDYKSSTPSVCTVSGDIVTLVTAGICTIAADQPGDATYQPAPTIIRSFTIADGGGSTGTIDTQAITFPQPADTDVLSGPVALAATASSGLTVAYTSITPGICSVTGSSVTLLAAGACTIKADQAGDASYAAASTVTRSFAVLAHGQTIAFAQPTTADLADTTVALTGTASSGLTVAFTAQTPSVCTVAGGTATLVAAGVCSIRADQPGNSWYSAALPVIRSFDVTDLVGGSTGVVALQTITFPQPPNTDVLAGPIALKATTDAGLPVSYTSLTPSVCTVSDALVTVVGVGVCTIDADQPGDVTHSAASTTTTSFTVAGLPQAITFSQPLTADVADVTISLAATADSGLGVTYTSSTPTVCTVAGSTITLLAAGGVCTVKADQPGDATRAPAPTITRSFAVTDGLGAPTVDTQDITFPAPTVSLSGGPVTLAATSDSGLPVSYTSGTPSVCAVGGTTLTPIGTGNCVVYADQPGNASFAAASTAVASFAIASGGGGGAVPVAPVATTSRIGGLDRDATAAQLATASYPTAGSAHVVVLARDDVYADALTGSPLAVTLDGPVLLTPTTTLSPSARAAIETVLPNDGLVICLGGVNAISAAVVSQLQGLGYQVQRIGGADRYATATLIADRVASNHAVSKVYLATGLNFADALPAADAAGLTNGVVLLTAGSQLPTLTTAWLRTHSASAIAIGGSAASAAPNATPIVGADRYATAAKVAAAVAPNANGIALATGANFPDGLAGAAFAAHSGWALLLVNPMAASLNGDQTAYLQGARASVRSVTTIGGASALPEAVAALVTAGLGG
jgi:uncharacterized repeat protein (TIGR01451 family)